MSFQTSLSLYRPQSPRGLTAATLAGFVREFATLGLAAPSDRAAYQVKFGRSVDQDDRSTTWPEPVPGTGGLISTWREIRYDAKDTKVPDLARLADALDGLPARSVYRATLFLGSIADPIRQALRRDPSKDDEAPLHFDDWTLELGPVECHALETKEPFRVGWLEVSLSGRGHPHPWTFRDLIARAEAAPGVPALRDLCRRTWPIDPPRVPLLHLRDSFKPPLRIIQLRKSMGDLWPYDDFDEPWDWCWGLRESR